MSTRRTLGAIALVVVVLVAAGWGTASRHYHAAHLLASLSSPPASASGMTSTPALEETELEVPRGERRIRSRIYRLAGGKRGAGVVVAHGVHYKGIDERRLVPFARALAREGLVVLTPELRELADYRIAVETAADIRESVMYLSSRGDLVDSPRVGVLGFSFAGGLALVAAAGPDMASHLSWALSIGGHHDLARVLRFFVDNEIPTPRGMEKRKAHDYGLVVMLYGNIGSFVPEQDRGAAGRALRAWLMEDRARAKSEADSCTTDACRELFARVRDGRAAELGPQVKALIASHEQDLAGLSPRGRLSSIRVPVHLLHGDGDSVIPPSESEWAAEELGSLPHSLLVTPLIEHVEVSKPAGWGQKAMLVDFMASIM